MRSGTPWGTVPTEGASFIGPLVGEARATAIANLSKGEVIMCKAIRAFLADEQGTETLEWGLVCGLLVVGAITAITLIGPKVSDMWSDLNNEIPEKD